MTSLILINIGNTHVQVALQEDSGIRLLEQYDTADIKVLGQIPILEKMPVPWRAAAVCVVPMAMELLEKRYPGKIRFLTCRDFPQLDFSLVDASTLGMDRVANAAAAFSIAESAVAVIDFGTCINTVAVSQDGHFLGGAIMPGRMLLRKSLSAYTAQLPLLPIRQEIPAPLGTNTLDAMAAGIDRGVLGSVKELIAATRSLPGMDRCPFVAAGGDAAFFLENLPGVLQPGQNLLTLLGVSMAADTQ